MHAVYLPEANAFVDPARQAWATREEDDGEDGHEEDGKDDDEQKETCGWKTNVCALAHGCVFLDTQIQNLI